MSTVSMRAFSMGQINVQEEIKTNDFRPIDLDDWLTKGRNAPPLDLLHQHDSNELTSSFTAFDCC